MDTEETKKTTDAEEAKEDTEEKAKQAEAPEDDAAEAETEEAEAEEAEAAVEGISETEEKLRKQVADLNDRYMRLYAEYDNYRKRTTDEKNAIYSTATADAFKELFPILDNFERAFDNKDASDEDFRKGVEMIYQQVQDIFKKAGMEPFGEPGETFDPNLHNAVMHVEDPDKGEGEIVAVFQKGYKLGDRIIRHAMVQVAN